MVSSTEAGTWQSTSPACLHFQRVDTPRKLSLSNLDSTLRNDAQPIPRDICGPNAVYLDSLLLRPYHELIMLSTRVSHF